MKYLVVDIETIAPTDEDMALELSLIKPNSNIKDPKKKETNVAEKKETAKRKAALLDSARIACIGIKSEAWTICFTTFSIPDDERKALMAAEIYVQQAKNEKQMLTDITEFLNQMNFECVVTFNGKNFDLPRIRYRCAVNGVQMSEIFQPRQKHIDLMIEYCRNYSMSGMQFISMCEVLQRLGITDGKPIDGSQFGTMIKDGEYTKAVLYNVLDCMLTEQIMFRLCQ